MAIVTLDGKSSASPDLRKTSASSTPTPITPTSTSCLWAAGLIIWAIVIYVMATPSHIADRHKKAVDEKLVSISQSLAEQKSSLKTQMDDIKSKMMKQKEALMEQTGLSMPEIDVKFNLPDINLPSLPGVVGKAHHEEEVGKLTEHHEEEVGKLKSEHEKLKSHHEAEVSQLQASIQKSEAELEKLRTAMASTKVDKDKFCPECPFDYGGLRTSCGARKAYLVSRHKTDEDVALEAVVKWDPNCLRKDTRHR